tara:strand:- start:115 stop:645 length:531 start_codon:yes stop_codon:yes gene_type:complete
MPTPQRIKKYKKLGIKTIINLRGGKKDGGWFLEKNACEQNGLELVNLVARSRAAPDKNMILKANAVFKSIKYPALIHCKSGADRAGIIAFLYKVLKLKENPEFAKNQLSLKYLHIKHAKTGILDAFCDLYIKYYKTTKNADFIYWTRNIYNPKDLEESFSENKFFEKIITKILRRE